MPKEGLEFSSYQAYPFINITKYIQKIISHLRGYLGDVMLTLVTLHLVSCIEIYKPYP